MAYYIKLCSHSQNFLEYVLYHILPTSNDAYNPKADHGWWNTTEHHMEAYSYVKWPDISYNWRSFPQHMLATKDPSVNMHHYKYLLCPIIEELGYRLKACTWTSSKSAQAEEREKSRLQRRVQCTMVNLIARRIIQHKRMIGFIQNLPENPSLHLPFASPSGAGKSVLTEGTYWPGWDIGIDWCEAT